MKMSGVAQSLDQILGGTLQAGTVPWLRFARTAIWADVTFSGSVAALSSQVVATSGAMTLAVGDIVVAMGLVYGAMQTGPAQEHLQLQVSNATQTVKWFDRDAVLTAAHYVNVAPNCYLQIAGIGVADAANTDYTCKLTVYSPTNAFTVNNTVGGIGVLTFRSS